MCSRLLHSHQGFFIRFNLDFKLLLFTLNNPTFSGTMSGSMNNTDFVRLISFTLSLSGFVFGFTVGDTGYPFCPAGVPCGSVK